MQCVWAQCQLGSVFLITVDLLGDKQAVACGWVSGLRSGLGGKQAGRRVGRWISSQLGPMVVSADVGIWARFSPVSLVSVDLLGGTQTVGMGGQVSLINPFLPYHLHVSFVYFLSLAFFPL